MNIKNFQRRFLFVFSVFMLFAGCKKEEAAAGGDRVEIYMLEACNFVQGKCQVSTTGAALNPDPVIANNDIFEYRQATHSFKISAAAMQRVSALRDGQPYAVTVDNKVIYYGVYKPAISSSSCDESITMGSDWSDHSRMRFYLGYPSGGTSVINDQRGDPLILSTLKKQGKLR